MVLNLSIFTVATFVEIDDCFHITRRYLHHNGHTYVTINLFQLVNQCTFGQVLHADINGRDDVGTVNRGGVSDIKESIAHLTTVNDTIRTTKDRVVRKFQTAASRIFSTEHIANSTLSK